MLGSLIIRPLRIATRGAQITLHGAREVVVLAEGFVDLVAAKLLGQNGHQDGDITAPDAVDEWAHNAADTVSEWAEEAVDAVTPTSGEDAGDAAAEPAAWQGPAASSTSSPLDSLGEAAEPGAVQFGHVEEAVTGSQAMEEDLVDAEPEPLMPEAEHVSEEPELVEEVAEPGAEEGAGAQLRIMEPWEGYRSMKAGDIIDLLASASREELAAVELYELAGRNRKSIVTAAQRALKQASPPH